MGKLTKRVFLECTELTTVVNGKKVRPFFNHYVDGCDSLGHCCRSAIKPCKVISMTHLTHLKVCSENCQIPIIIVWLKIVND